MSVNYDYAYAAFTSLDPSLTEPNPTTLEQELAAAGLVAFETIFNNYPTVGNCRIIFSNTVDPFTLSGVVAAHTGLDPDGDPPNPNEVYLEPNNFKEWKLNPSTGQVSFILPSAPIKGEMVAFKVNGVDYNEVTHYTLSGQTITWGNIFVLENDDEVVLQWWSAS